MCASFLSSYYCQASRLDSGGGSGDDELGLLLLSDEEHAAAQAASVVVTYAVLFDNELAAAVMAQHAKVSARLRLRVGVAVCCLLSPLGILLCAR